MEVTHEGSMSIYNKLLENPQSGPLVPPKHRKSPYDSEDKHRVAIVKTDNRIKGIKEALRLLGGNKKLFECSEGEIVIKPNCNTDTPFPRDTHPDTVRGLIEFVTDAGFPPSRIIVGDMSGRFRGLPTRHTMENLGITRVANEYGVRLSYFEEEQFVRLKPPMAEHWPKGIKIPLRIYEADRVILTPIMRSHSTATFTLSQKLAVGLIDAVDREWLHTGKDFYEKMIELNLAFSTDLVLTDAIKMNIGPGIDPVDEVEPGIIIASSNIVAADAVGVSIMKYYNTHRVKSLSVKTHKQFTLSEGLGLGSPHLKDMEMETANLTHSESFDTLINEIMDELC